MAQTLLNSVNEVLKRTGVIAGDSGLLTTLTDSGRQVAIDTAIQVINEGIDELYTVSRIAQPNEQAENTITLVEDQQSYTLATDLVQLRFPIIDKTNNQYLLEFQGGYNTLLILDPERNDTGLPHWAMISPVNGELVLDRKPTVDDAGRVYTYQYDKDLSLNVAADVVPFKDVVHRAMVPSWVQLWKRERRQEFDAGLFRSSMGRASRLLTQKLPRSHYCPR